MNKKLFTPLFLAASFLVVGCSASEIIARPSWIDDPIVINPEGESYKDNTLKEIYDAIKNLGDTNSNVLNKVMYEIAQKQLGHFIDWKDKDGNSHLGLKTVAKENATDEQINQFVSEYPVYKSEDKGFKKGAENFEDLTDAQKTQVSRAKIQEQYKRIVENIFEKLYNDIKDGTYSNGVDKKLFQEQYFIDHLYEEMYWPDETSVTSRVSDKVLLPKTANKTWREYVNANGDDGFLHVMKNDGTDDFYGLYFPHTEKEPDGGYIGRKILPEIYRTLLIENYVREQRATNLGRSYARKVNMINIAADDNNKEKVLAMLNHFVKEYITGENEDSPKKIVDDDYNFEHLTNAMIGFAMPDPTSPAPTIRSEMDWSYELLEAGRFNPVTITSGGKQIELVWETKTNKYGEGTSDGDTYVYEGTKLGDLIKKYLLTQDVTYTAPAAGDPTSANFTFSTKDHFDSEAQSAYNDITNNSAYDLDTGLMVKEREIRMTDMTTDGWFLKSGGITDLAEKWRDNLFNIKTSNIIDDEEHIESTSCKSDDTVRYFGELPTSGDLSNRKAFLRKSGNKPYEQIILNDGNNFSIVEVEEAASASKLSYTDPNGSYLALRATEEIGKSNAVMDGIVRKVTEKVADSDTYKKNAEQYYLMISNIIFNDQSVYDYFKSQFPDLFK